MHSVKTKVQDEMLQKHFSFSCDSLSDRCSQRLLVPVGSIIWGGYGTSRMWRELAGGSPLLGQALRVCRLAQLLALSACFGELRCHCSASSSCHHTFFTVSDIDPSETISQCKAFLMRLLVMLLHQSTIKVTNTPSFQNNSIYT